MGRGAAAAFSGRSESTRAAAARPGPPASADIGVENSACGGCFRARSRETAALWWPPVQREPGVPAVIACRWVSSLEAGGSLLGLHKKLVGIHFFSFPCSRTAGEAVVTLPRNDVKNIPRESCRDRCAVPGNAVSQLQTNPWAHCWDRNGTERAAPTLSSCTLDGRSVSAKTLCCFVCVTESLSSELQGFDRQYWHGIWASSIWNKAKGEHLIPSPVPGWIFFCASSVVLLGA